MTDSASLRLFARGATDILDALVAKNAGGAKLDQGVAERITSRFPGVTAEITTEPGSGVADLRRQLEDGTSRILTDRPAVVILSIGDDVAGLPGRGDTAESAVEAVKEDLLASIDLIKEKVGAHILVANASTVDPDDHAHNYHALDVEPVVLRIQRLDLMLINASHEAGVSVIDIDRLMAELGAGDHIEAAMRYDAAACEKIADETVRILEDYGFFDDRPLLAQMGAGRAGDST